MTNYVEGKEYDIFYTIGEKVYKEKNFIVLTNRLESDLCQSRVVDFCFGERGTRASKTAISLIIVPIALFSAVIFGLATGISQIAIAGATCGTASCCLPPCVAHCGHAHHVLSNEEVYAHPVTAEIVTTLPQLQQHSFVGDTIETELAYDGKKSFMKFLKSLEKSKTLKINNITQHSRLIIKVPKVIIGVGQKLNLDKLYDKYQVYKLFNKYHNTKKQLILKIPFDIQHKGEEKSGSGYIEYIGINHSMEKTTTDDRGRRYQVGKTIEQLKIKRNYVVTAGHMFLISRWTSYTIHERKREKIIYKDEEIETRIDANGDVKVSDKYLKTYQQGKINIANGSGSIFIGDIPFADVVACGRWKNGVIKHNFAATSTYQAPFLSGWKPLSTSNVITTEPSSSIELANVRTTAMLQK
ncbi:MAG: hypothetical protein sL5_09520 [Candidatus Mesenet longicola]|uniref:Uncharacterized protein n=1 Tax=Candidatus Mesenet longicola TaxID=1892558 RepID=A0A8J3MMH9_9RICK|nr:MAG: hypothetical protein sGL2_10120 [Candidatus Mesenet longicola]GHM59959.1 MAG: hypothetical protein sL5_09520 [Candidatus Mesenet longicola]